MHKERSETVCHLFAHRRRTVSSLSTDRLFAQLLGQAYVSIEARKLLTVGNYEIIRRIAKEFQLRLVQNVACTSIRAYIHVRRGLIS